MGRGNIELKVKNNINDDIILLSGDIARDESAWRRKRHEKYTKENNTYSSNRADVFN